MLARDSSCFVSSAHCFSNRLSLFCKRQQVNLKIHFNSTFQKHMNPGVQKPIFAAVDHLSRPRRKQKVTSNSSKGHSLWFVIGGFWSILSVSVFQGSFLVACSSKKHYCKLIAGFLFQSLFFIEKRSNLIGHPWLFCLQSSPSLLLILTRDACSRENDGNRILSLSFPFFPSPPALPLVVLLFFPFPTWEPKEMTAWRWVRLGY